MERVIDSIENGQWSAVWEQMQEENVTFKELAANGVSANDIAVLADMLVT